MHKLVSVQIQALLLITLLLVLGNGVAEDQSESTDSEGQQLFHESVHILGGRGAPVVRWNRPVHVAIVGAADESLQAYIRSIFNQISLLSGIRYRLVQHNFETAGDYALALSDSPDYELSVCDTVEKSLCANFVVILSDRSSMHQVAAKLPMRPVYQRATAKDDGDLLCFFSPGIYRRLEIVSSIVYVDSDSTESMQRTCLQEEIYQSFGLFGDYSNSEFYSFNNKVQEKQVTVYDKRLLISLYDHAFRPGTMASKVATQVVSYCEPDC